MKPLLLLLFFSSMGQLVFAQVYVDQHHYLPFEDTGKNIVSMQATRYKTTVVDGKVVPGEKTNAVQYFYDKHGKLVRRIILFPVQNGKIKYLQGEGGFVMQHAFNDSVLATSKCVYDKHGNLIEMEHDPLIYNMSGKFTYDHNNNLTSVTQYNSDQNAGLDKIQTYSYNNHNKLTEIDELNPAHELLAKTTFEYDSLQRLIGQSFINSKREVSSRTMVYDTAHGKLLQLILTTLKGRHPRIYGYEYDGQGRQSNIYQIHNGVKNLYSSFKYDTLGQGYQYTENMSTNKIVQTISKRLKKRVSYSSGQLRDYQDWQYDKYGNVVSYTVGYYTRVNVPEPVLSDISIIIYEIKYRNGVKLKEKPYPDKFKNLAF